MVNPKPHSKHIQIPWKRNFKPNPIAFNQIQYSYNEENQIFFWKKKESKREKLLILEKRQLQFQEYMTINNYGKKNKVIYFLKRKNLLLWFDLLQPLFIQSTNFDRFYAFSRDIDHSNLFIPSESTLFNQILFKPSTSFVSHIRIHPNSPKVFPNPPNQTQP